MSGDDSKQSNVAADKFLADAFKKKIHISLDKVLETKACLLHTECSVRFSFEVRLSPASEIMKAQNNQSVPGYKLES